MPTREELRSLYSSGIYAGDWGPFENSGYWVWTGEERDSSSAWTFKFNHGIERYIDRDDGSNARAFAVRS